MDNISQLKDRLKKDAIRGLALDIDETLSDTNPHWFEHMFNFHQPEGLTKEEVMKKYRFVENVPEWLTEESRKYMEETLHSNEFNEAIPLIEGADRAVRKLNTMIPIVAYITARPSTVAEGTRKWIKKHDFPEAELITRPEDVRLENLNQSKNTWKARVLCDLYPEVLGIVDDNPTLAHELEALQYEGTLYLYGKEWDEFKDHKHVVVCPTWQDVLKATRVRFPTRQPKE